MINSVFSIRSKSGSLLIWSVMLGFVLTSVFFFCIVRQRATIAIQQDTAEILNARQYLESYADYIQNLPQAKLEELKPDINYDGITGTLTNVVSEITGVADTGADPASYNFGGDIFIEWNKCSDNLKGSLIVNNALKDVLYEHNTATAECLSSASGYDDLIGPITVASPFTIKTLNAPFYYHITPKDALTHLIDNKWQLDIKSDLDYGKKVEVKRTF